VDKPSIAKKIMSTVRSRGGRFLQRLKLCGKGDSEKHGWVEIDDTRVYEKVCQALREGAPKIRQQMLKISVPETLEKENPDNMKQSFTRKE
jgi:hypothetical protein